MTSNIQDRTRGVYGDRGPAFALLTRDLGSRWFLGFRTNSSVSIRLVPRACILQDEELGELHDTPRPYTPRMLLRSANWVPRTDHPSLCTCLGEAGCSLDQSPLAAMEMVMIG